MPISIGEERFLSLPTVHGLLSMFIISERINGLFTSVGKAIDRRDACLIQALAIKQLEHGAHALDINVGPGREDGPAAMDWLVRTVQEVADSPSVIRYVKA